MRYSWAWLGRAPWFPKTSFCLSAGLCENRGLWSNKRNLEVQFIIQYFKILSLIVHVVTTNPPSVRVQESALSLLRLLFFSSNNNCSRQICTLQRMEFFEYMYLSMLCRSKPWTFTLHKSLRTRCWTNSLFCHRRGDNDHSNFHWRRDRSWSNHSRWKWNVWTLKSVVCIVNSPFLLIQLLLGCILWWRI